MFQKAKVLIELDWSTRKMEVFGKKRYRVRGNFYQTPRKVQNSFLKRALIPYDYNTGVQIKDFCHDFLKEGTFKNQKLT